MPSKATELLKAVERYKAMMTAQPDPEQLLREVPDEQFRVLVYTAAELLKTLKAEALRRGIWDDFKTRKAP